MCQSKCEYKYNVGDVIKDIKIIKQIRKTPNRKNGQKSYPEKAYVCKCMKCGYESEKYESQLNKKYGCPVCCGNIVMKGYNDIATTDKWMLDFLLNKEDGYKYKSMSNKKVDMICPNCGNIKNEFIYVLKQNHRFSCPCCSDGISFPEKLLTNIFKYLKIEYISQYRINKYKYKYDFYLPEFDIIIELHGKQHYDSGRNKYWKTYEEEHENDMFKYDIAVLNGFEYNKNYFIIDCFYSDVEYIFNNIKKTLLKDLLLNIDYNELCNIVKKSEKSLMLIACELKNKNNNMTSSDIADIIGVDRHTVRLYLKKGKKYNMCNYDENSERNNGRNKGLKKANENKKMRIEVYKDNIFCGEFNSITELVNISEEKFGIKFSQSRISLIKNTNKKIYGYNFIVRDENEEKINR